MKVKRFFLNQRNIFLLAAAFTIILSIQHIMLGPKFFFRGTYTFYNNYVIFKSSFGHLISGLNLYSVYEKEYADLYKYSPTFALFMAPFSRLPDLIGLPIWNLLNSLLLLMAIAQMKNITPQKFCFIFFFVLLELSVSIQHAQSNCLIAALIIFAFNAFEKNRPSLAAFCLLSGAFIKLFTLPACILFIFYPRKIRFLLSAPLWTSVLVLLPLLVISPTELLDQYVNWKEMLMNDHGQSTGMSIYGIIGALARPFLNKPIVLLAGMIMLLLPLTRTSAYENESYRRKYLAFLLLWLVIFNHKAESPSYIIAFSGIAIWASDARVSKIFGVFLFLTWFFSSAFKTDLIPAAVRNQVNEEVIFTFMPAILLFWLFISLMRKTKKVVSTPELVR